MESLPVGSLERLQLLEDVVNTLISSLAHWPATGILAHERLVRTLNAAMKPSPAVLEFAGSVAWLAMHSRGDCSQL